MATKKETPAKKAAPKKAVAPKKTAVKKTTAKSKPKAQSPKLKAQTPENPHIGLVRNDGWLEPFEDAIRGRHDHAVWKINQLTQNGKKKLSDFATGHLYFGLHKLPKGWVFREWAPNATDIYLIGDFNDWQENEKYRCKRIAGTDNWELKLSEKAMKHGQLYKMKVKWNGGEGERIPAWCQRVDENLLCPGVEPRESLRVQEEDIQAQEEPAVDLRVPRGYGTGCREGGHLYRVQGQRAASYHQRRL